MRIHFVVSIIQLKSVLHKSDSYNCQLNVNLLSIKNNVFINKLTADNNIETASVYEIECLFNKWTQ